jgi:hypothetical protein
VGSRSILRFAGSERARADPAATSMDCRPCHRAYYFANAGTARPSISIAMGFVEVTRDFIVPGVSFNGRLESYSVLISAAARRDMRGPKPTFLRRPQARDLLSLHGRP